MWVLFTMSTQVGRRSNLACTVFCSNFVLGRVMEWKEILVVTSRKPHELYLGLDEKMGLELGTLTLP